MTTLGRDQIEDYFCIMLRSFVCLLLVTVVCLASPSFKRVVRLSDPFGELGWELQELQVEDYVKGSVWPKPQGETPSGAVYKLTPENFQFSITGESSDVLKEAVERYKVLTFPDNVSASKKNLSQITKLTVDVVDKYENLTLDSDESCK